MLRTEIWNLDRYERACNWLALGVLLAAWNAVDKDWHGAHVARPPALEVQPIVTVRTRRIMGE
jgi:hypothetical protein